MNFYLDGIDFGLDNLEIFRGSMRLLNNDPRIEIVAASGIVRVTLRPCPSWFVLLFEISIACILGVGAYRNWTTTSPLVRTLLILAVLSTVGESIYRLSGTEIIEFDMSKLSICKEFRGWERRREYRIEEYSQLEWIQGAEDTPQSLRCSLGWKSITFGKDLSEDQALEIFAALQQALPGIAQKISSFPAGKDHFITLRTK